MFKLRNISIKTKLIAYSILIVTFISLFISLTSYMASEDAIKEQAGQLVSTSVEQVMKRTDLFLKNIHNIAMIITFSDNIVGMLSKDKFDYNEDFTRISQSVNYFLLLNNVNSYIRTIYIYDLKHMNIVSTNGYVGDIQKDDENYKTIRDNFISKKYFDSPFLWIGTRKVKVGEEAKTPDTSTKTQNGTSDVSIRSIMENVSTFMMPIMNRNSADIYGVLIINISEISIASIYSNSNLVSSGDFYVEDPLGTIISAVNKRMIGNGFDIQKQKRSGNTNSFLTRINGGEEYLITSFTSSYNRWKYVSVIPMNELMKKNISNIKNIFILIVLVAIALIIIISLAFNSFFYKPVKVLMNGIRASVQNHGEIDLKVERNDEIGFIFSNFNEILRENNKLMKEVYDQKITTKNSELRLLQSQINPHFLYNSLDTAICMIKLNDNKIALTVIEALVKLFRLSLGKSNEVTTVRKMLENLNSYITIQQIRYREKLNIEMNIEDDIMECKVLNLLLQPLVENSIFHGIEKKRGIGNIHITGKREDALLIFIVEDNGVGMHEDKLAEINSLIDSNEFDQENYYALQNINKRVKLYYGEQYGITVESRENEWTKVTLFLPFESA